MNPDTNKQLAHILAVDEGTGPMKNGRYLPYDDATGDVVPQGSRLIGKLTIGTGRNLTDRGINADEQALMLSNDLLDNERDSLRCFPWMQSLDVPRYVAVMNMCFNMGADNFKAKFPNTVAMMSASQWGAVASALRGSLWHQQVGARADRIIHTLETGEL